MKLNRKYMGMVLITILFFSMLSGCTEKNDQNEDDNEIRKIVYEFTIESENKTDFELILPIPVYSSNRSVVQSEYSDKNFINQTGYITGSLTDTIYGTGFKVSCNNSSKLKYSSEIKNPSSSLLDETILSMFNKTSNDSQEYYCNIWYNGTERVNLYLKYHYEGAGYGHMIGTTIHSKNIELTQGWQSVLVDNRIPTP